MLYTIGHSNVSLEYFLNVIKNYNINILCDIRITPYSSYVPHFNKEDLAINCKKNNIIYVHKKELGSSNIYPLITPTNEILEILKKISKVSTEKNVVLMSDGWDYKNCHRTILANWIRHYFNNESLFINIKDSKIFTIQKLQLNMFN